MPLPTTVYDLIYVNVTGAPGTGTFTIGAAVAGFRALSTIPNGTQISYGATDGTRTEVSKGTVGGSGTTLTRGEDTIAGTNGTSLVNFTASGVLVAAIWSGFDMTLLLSTLATAVGNITTLQTTIDGGSF